MATRHREALRAELLDTRARHPYTYEGDSRRGNLDGRLKAGSRRYRWGDRVDRLAGLVIGGTAGHDSTCAR